MAIFNTKQKAKAKAEELASKYNIQYSPEGDTFTIHGKEDPTGVAMGTDEMVSSDKWLSSLSRKKRLTTKEYQKIAEEQNLDTIKKLASDEKAKLDFLQKQLDIEKKRNAKLLIAKTKQPVITKLTKNKIKSNKNIKSDIVTTSIFDTDEKGYPISKKPLEWNFIHSEHNMQKFLDANLTDWDKQQINWGKRNKLTGDIVPKESVLSSLRSTDMNWSMPTANKQIITPNDVSRAQKKGQEYIQVGKNLYNVEQLITKLTREGRWNANVSLDKKGISDLKYSSDIEVIPFMVDDKGNFILKKWGKRKTTLLPRSIK